MRILCEFELFGFERLDMGEAGAVFIKYEKQGAPTIEESVFFRGAPGREHFHLELGKRQAVACAIVTRSSKNRYRATAYAGKRIQTFKQTSIDGLRSELEKFFEEAA